MLGSYSLKKISFIYSLVNLFKFFFLMGCVISITEFSPHPVIDHIPEVGDSNESEVYPGDQDQSESDSLANNAPIYDTHDHKDDTAELELKPIIGGSHKPIVDENHHNNNDDSYHEALIHPRYGNNSKESEMITLWENECLQDSYNEVVHNELEDEDHSDEELDYLSMLEKDFIDRHDFYNSIDLTNFLNSIEMKQRMSLLDYNFTPAIIIIIVFISLLLLCIIGVCIASFSKLRSYVIEGKRCCNVCCLLIILCCIFFIGVSLLVSFRATHMVRKTEKHAMCEATRLPHTLFFGNPEIHFGVDTKQNFMGFENIRKFTQLFVLEQKSFTSGNNKSNIEDIKDSGLKDSINSLYSKVDDFFTKYEEVKGVNGHGEEATPFLISYSLPIYKTFMTQLLDKYESVSDRLLKVEHLSPILEDSSASDEFFNNLKESIDKITNIQITLSEFWNFIMYTSFDGIVIYKVSVVILAIMSTLSFISLCILLFTFCKKKTKRTLKNKGGVRCLTILVLLLLFWSVLALFEISRGVFTTFYGCALMHKIKTDPASGQTLIESHLQGEPLVKNVFKYCYFEPQPNGSSNFYHLLEDHKQRAALQDYLGFLDALKVVEEDLETLISTKDTFYTNMFVDALYSFRKAETYDFGDIESQFNELNEMFSCSHIYYSFGEDGCSKMPLKKTECVRIDSHPFGYDDCVGNRSKSSQIFSRLQNYINREEEFIDEMLNDLIDESNPNSIARYINKTVQVFHFIQEKIQNLETNLRIHFEGLKHGPLEEWLDCTVIKKDVNRSYDKICEHDVFEMSSHADLYFLILVLIFCATICIFCLSFCYKEEESNNFGEDRKKKKKKNKNQGFDRRHSDVFDDNENDSFHTKDEDDDDNYLKKNNSDSELFDTFKNNENNNKHGNFETIGGDTFENDYKPHKSNAINLRPGKDNTVNVNMNKNNDDFDDPFNNDSSENHYNFEK